MSMNDADFLFTLKFDEAGNWKTVKTHQISKKELEAEQWQRFSPFLNSLKQLAVSIRI